MGKMITIKRMACTQAIVFEMLREFDRICKEENIPYSLAGGTLLGALRHKDLIPWDDDIDLFMLRKDYDRFLEKFAGKELSNPYYKVIDINTGFAGQTFARMVDLRTHTSSKLSLTFKNLWIDILPVDAVPDGYNDRRKFETQMRKLRRWRVLFNLPPWKGKTLLKKLIKTPIAALGRWLGFRTRVCKKIISTAQCYEDTNVREAGEIVAQGWIKGTMDRSTFAQSVEVELRGQMFSAMPDYNHYLTGQYGDYLTLPPKKQRKAHKINVQLEIDKYDGELKEKLMYFINKMDIEEKNLRKLEEMRQLEEQARLEALMAEDQEEQEDTASAEEPEDAD